MNIHFPLYSTSHLVFGSGSQYCLVLIFQICPSFPHDLSSFLAATLDKEEFKTIVEKKSEMSL